MSGATRHDYVATGRVHFSHRVLRNARQYLTGMLSKQRGLQRGQYGLAGFSQVSLRRYGQISLVVMVGWACPGLVWSRRFCEVLTRPIPLRQFRLHIVFIELLTHAFLG